MGKLASKQNVLDLLSIRTTTQSTQAIGRALETATSIAGSLLGTGFDLETRLDRYRPTREDLDTLRKGEPHGFLFTNGFLPQDKAKVYGSSKVIADIADTETTSLLESSVYLIEPETGVLTLDSLPVSGFCTLLVRYESGFEVDGDDVYQEVPQWLRDAVVTSCIEVLRANVITANKKDNLTDMTTALTRELRTILYAHMRPRYGITFAFHTKVF